MNFIVPTPKKCEVIDENEVRFPLAVNCEYAQFEGCSEVLKSAFEKIFEVKLMRGKGGIEICYNPDMQEGAYRVRTEKSIRLEASDYDGIMYAAATLLQVVKVKKESMSANKIVLEDYPEKEYRAFMIDLGRQWHPFNKLLRYVDICFLYKIKYLHLHFVDNFICSLPSKEYPKLSTPGKHYTFEQIKELCEYAKTRGVVLIPEYEGPGHAEQFTEKYPDIFANVFEDDDKGKVMLTETGTKIKAHGLMCVGSQRAQKAMEKLILEICEMFPDAPYIHLGGDEANIKLWEECSVCREYMKANHIENVKQLYADYLSRMANLCLRCGKIPIVWEGFPKEYAKDIPRETVVIAWESYYNDAEQLLRDGFRIINASWQPLYIVPSVTERWNPTDIMKWNVYNWQHWWKNSKAYLNPIHVAPTENVLGGMLCAWEQTYEREINSVIENLAAVSERLWSVERVCDDEEFLGKLSKVTFLASRLIAE